MKQESKNAILGALGPTSEKSNSGGQFLTNFRCQDCSRGIRFPISPTQKAGERDGHVLFFRSFSQPPRLRGSWGPSVICLYNTPILLQSTCYKIAYKITYVFRERIYRII